MQHSGSKNFVFFASLILYCTYGLLVLMSTDKIYFWDTVQLGAKHGLYFFDTNFKDLLLPDEIDSGHVPIFGAYLSILWMIFGKTLVVSHLAMLPIVFLLVYQVIKLSKLLIKNDQWLILSCLILADPTLVAQGTLISPDVLLMAAFVGALRYIYQGANHIWKYLLFLILALVSMRGIMILAVLFVWECYLLYSDNKRKLTIAILFPYIFAGIPFVMYQFWHYIEKGWIGYHSLSPWAPSFEKVGIIGVFKNVVIMAWRIMDFGRWPFMILLIYFGFKRFRKGIFDEWMVLLILMVVGLGYSFVTYSGLQGHRYLMPLYTLNTIIVIRQMTLYKILNLVSTLLMVSLITGHAWIYPRSISQGWDASLAHRPYLNLWAEASKHIDTNGIQYDQIGTAFPNVNSIRSLTLEDNKTAFSPMIIGSSKYLLVSSIMNEIKEEDLTLIHKEYTLVRSWQEGGLTMEFWKLKQ